MARLLRVGGLLPVILALLSVPAQAQEGVLDTAFGDSGYVLTPRYLTQGGQIATAPNGDVVFAASADFGGYLTHPAPSPTARVMRIASDGSKVLLLATIPGSWANDVAVQPDGKIVVGGSAQIGP